MSELRKQSLLEAAEAAETAQNKIYNLVEKELDTRYPANGETRICNFPKIGLGVRNYPSHRSGCLHPDTWYVDAPHMVKLTLNEAPLHYVILIARALANS